MSALTSIGGITVEHPPPTRTGRTRRHASVVVVALVLAGLGLPFGITDVRAATIPTTTTVTGPSQPVDVPGLVTVTIQISPAPQAQDGYIPAVTVHWDENYVGPEPIGGDGSATSSRYAGDLGPGTHTVYAVFEGFNDFAASESDPITIHVGSATATYLTSSREPALSTQDVTYTATVAGKPGYPQPADPPTGGTLTITDTTTSTLLGSLDVAAGARTLVVTTKLALGNHVLVAEYSGAGLYRASSTQLTQTIQPDLVVDVTGVSSTPATFYPVTDAYKDSVSIRGSRREPVAVLIRIYSTSTGKLVRSASVASGSGAYAWAWNGRSASGTLQAAGKYRIVQTLTDAAANRLVVNTYATISLKRLYYTTVTLPKAGDAYSLYADPGNGSISQGGSAYGRGVKLSSGRAGVAVGYSFTMPSATVYKSITFKVLGRSPNGTSATIAIWNPGWGAYRDVSSYSQSKSIGPGYKWYSTTGPGSVLHSGRTARTVVYVEYGPGTKVFDVAKVSLVVNYGVLR
jgi:hypothetical protein